MNLQVEVLKRHLPGSAVNLSCQIEALGSDEVNTDSATLAEDATKVPALNFNFSKASSHVALTFIASSQGGKEEVGSCLYPITFNYHTTRLFGQLISPKLFNKTHLAHLSNRVPGLNVHKIVGKIWFRVKDLRVPSMVQNVRVEGNWLDMRTVQQPHGKQHDIPKPDMEELLSREAQGCCIAVVPGDTPVVSVLFHSITIQSTLQLPADNILTVACMGSDPGVKENSLFNYEDGLPWTTPTLKPITLKCGSNDTVLELHAVDSLHKREPSFSSSCPLPFLIPFQHCNWEYNWRWVPGMGGFSPEHSQGNLEPNVTVSVVYWPSSSDSSQHEGLEVFIKEVEFLSQQEKTDLVLTCQLKDGTDLEATGGADTPPYAERKDSIAEDEDFDPSATVIKYSSNNRGSSGYYFFSSDPNFTSSSGGHQIVLTLHATSHNASLWWRTEVKSTATVKLPEELRWALSRPGNEEGVRLELSENDISDAFTDTLKVKRLTGILRWKKNDAKFLGLETITHLSTLPLLSEISVMPVSISPTTSDGELPGSDVLISAVKKMVRDILRLEEENALLKAENRDYEKFVVDKESIIVTAANQKALLPFTKMDLIHKIVELSEYLKAEIRARKIFQSKMHKLKNKLIKKSEIEAHYMDLQRAHESQQMIVRELQAKVTKYRKCWEMCKQQESIIEQLLAHQGSATLITPAATRENSKHTDVVEEPQRMQNKNLRTQEETTLENFREELSRVRRTVHELDDKAAQLSEHQHSSTSHPGREESKVATLETQVKVAAVRERALMEELRSNIARWAEEKSRYEMEIARMQGQHSSHSQMPRSSRSQTPVRIGGTSAGETGSIPGTSKVSNRARYFGSTSLNAVPATTATSGTGAVPPRNLTGGSTGTVLSRNSTSSIDTAHSRNSTGAVLPENSTGVVPPGNSTGGTGAVPPGNSTGGTGAVHPRDSTTATSGTGDVLSSIHRRPSQQLGRHSIATSRGSDASVHPLPTPLSTAQRHSLSNTTGDHPLHNSIRS